MRVVLQPTWVSGGSTTRHAPALPVPGAAPTLAAGLNSHATERPNLRAAAGQREVLQAAPHRTRIAGAGGVRVIVGDEAGRPEQEAGIHPEPCSHGRGSVASSPSANGNPRADRAIGQALRRLPQARSGGRHRWSAEPHVQARTGCKSRAVASRRAATAGYRYGARPSDGAVPLVDGQSGTDHPSRAQAANGGVSVPG
jgi:hypothetical protein